VASLAFYQEPKKHLKNVALGASLGLYVGLLLGTYMIYSVPEPGESKPKKPEPENDNPLNVPEEAKSSEDALLNIKKRVSVVQWHPLLDYDFKEQKATIGFSYHF
jgi:hypothetical protein